MAWLHAYLIQLCTDKMHIAFAYLSMKVTIG